jgi:hypothetical protein
LLKTIEEEFPIDSRLSEEVLFANDVDGCGDRSGRKRVGLMAG